jgi:hypothetical protein
VKQALHVQEVGGHHEIVQLLFVGIAYLVDVASEWQV